MRYAGVKKKSLWDVASVGFAEAAVTVPPLATSSGTCTSVGFVRMRVLKKRGFEGTSSLVGRQQTNHIVCAETLMGFMDLHWRNLRVD